MIFVFDKIQEKPYPNLADHSAKPYTKDWRKYSLQWPFSEPVHFLEYLDQENINYTLVDTNNAPAGAVYPVSLSFFDFSVHWPSLLPKAVKEKNLTVWFLYSEGDNPFRIKQHLDQQLQGIRYHFTSANTASQHLKNFSSFVDDELLYRLRNKSQAEQYHEQQRTRKFTALSRTHKWWRATTMARLWRQNIHHFGYFSYNTELDVGEAETDNPIEVDSFDNLRKYTKQFLANGPYRADRHTSEFHNLHQYTIPEHHNNSYLNFVLETHLDVDQSEGVFLTEKTFKPIKHCQLFVILGPAGSVEQLRKMGYSTFDHVLDHGYDTIKNNTQRWDATLKEFEHLILHENLHHLYMKCKDDLLHNQQLFLNSKSDRLNSILQKVSNA